MGSELIWTALSVGLVIFLRWVWRVVDDLWWRPKRLEKCLRDQGYRGNPYRLWYGDLEEMAAMTAKARSRPINLSDNAVPYVLPFHHHIVEKYGKNCFIWDGPNPRVIVMDPEMVKEILNKYSSYPKPKSSPLTGLLVRGLVELEGEHWARHRKIVNPAFHLEKLKLMVPAIYESCIGIVNKWEKLVLPNGSCDIDVWPHLENLTGEVISKTTFSSNYKEGERVFRLQKEQAKHTFDLLQSKYIPGSSYLPTKTNKRMKEIHREVHTRLRDMIIRRENALRMGEAKNQDLLGLLLESNLKEVEANGNKQSNGITIEDVIEECKLFYFAGQETTTNLLAWTMVMLGQHQEWQARARAEVLEVLGSKKEETKLEGLNHLKIVTMILNETLRMFPPAPMLLRSTNEATKLRHLTLPPGVDLILPKILLHYDTEFWGADAKEFNPRRFSDGISKAVKNTGAFFPFSAGPRICIGMNLAIVESKLALAMILQNFSFQISPLYKHAPFPNLTLQPFYGAKFILQKI